MATPLVSIIIPCYNSARYIPALVKSLLPVLANTPERFEVIFVDDGSADNSANLMKELMPGIVSLRQQNRGLAAARNTGVAVAKGEFLQFLDTDDTLEPGKIEKQAAAGADVVYSDWRLLTVGGKNVRTEIFAPAQAPCEMVEALLNGWYVPVHSYLCRRSAFLEMGGFDESIKVWEDFDLFLRFAIAGRQHVYVPGIFSNYYRFLDVKSLARRDPVANAVSRERVLLKALDILKMTNGLTESRRKAAARALFGVLRTAGNSDPVWLQNANRKIHELDPGFKPHGSAAYRMIAGILGIVLTERIAVKLRRR